jgi:hypothetical protein
MPPPPPAPRRKLTAPSDIHPDDLERLMAHVGSMQLHPYSIWEKVEFRRRRKDGSWAEVEASGSCDGVCFYGIMRDASEQHAAEAALRDLLLSSAHELRVSAQNILAASTLLQERESVRADSVRALAMNIARARVRRDSDLRYSFRCRRRRHSWQMRCRQAARCCPASSPTSLRCVHTPDAAAWC